MSMYDADLFQSADSIGATRPSDRAIGAPRASGLYNRLGKRTFDIAMVLLAAPLILLVTGLLAWWVSRDGGKPFYSQTRIGRDGQMFRMWKLRTMVVDADEVLEKYLDENPKARLEWELMQKLDFDPRITRTGRILRKTSLDELPQLFNVLRGDMSVVGPRPFMVHQDTLYPGTAYYTMRPGLTGSWQVSDRNASTFAERARFDTSYGRQLSLLTDVKLIALTFGAVLRGTGK